MSEKETIAALQVELANLKGQLAVYALGRELAKAGVRPDAHEHTLNPVAVIRVPGEENSIIQTSSIRGELVKVIVKDSSSPQVG